MQPKLKQTQKEVAEMMVKIQSDTEKANETKAMVAEQSEQAAVKAAECKGIKVLESRTSWCVICELYVGCNLFRNLS